jgi:PAS domain S-box-containing protein
MEYAERFLRWFSGGDAQYMPSLHCMKEDITWIVLIVSVCLLNALGYAIIATHWQKNEKLMADGDAKEALRRLKWIFILCGTCGYVFIPVKMVWPAWRLFFFVMCILCYHTWRYALRSRNLRIICKSLGDTTSIQQERDHLKLVADLILNSIFQMSPNGQDVIWCNRRWYDEFGLYGDDRKHWLSLIHPDDQQQVLSLWNEAVLSGVIFEHQYRVRHRDGQYRWKLGRCAPSIENCQVTSWIGTITDIHEQKIREEKMCYENEQRRFFLNAISHDLRSPLNIARLQAGAAKVMLDEGDVSGTKQALFAIDDAMGVAKGMLNRLLEIARSGKENKQILDDFCISDSITSLVRNFEQQATIRGLYIRVGKSDIHVRLDRGKFERILTNMVENAIKYTDEGGVSVIPLVEDSNVTVLVCDTGIGIAQKDQQHLFDEFYQVGNYERSTTKGFGLGLAISRELARQLGGDVILRESTPGQGSVFAIILPGIVTSTDNPQEATYS